MLRVENGPDLKCGLDGDWGLRISEFLPEASHHNLLSSVSCQGPARTLLPLRHTVRTHEYANSEQSWYRMIRNCQLLPISLKADIINNTDSGRSMGLIRRDRNIPGFPLRVPSRSRNSLGSTRLSFCSSRMRPRPWHSRYFPALGSLNAFPSTCWSSSRRFGLLNRWWPFLKNLPGNGRI